MTEGKPAAVHPLRIPGLASALAMQVHAVTDVHVSAEIAATGIWEPQETQFLLDTLRPGDVFVDVGANIGYFSLLASRLVGPRGAVLAFEPEAANFALLEANSRLNGCDNVRCFQAALGEENASGTLYLNELNRGDHSLYPAQQGRAGQGISIVNGSTLIAATQPRVNCIKIDTQGAECDVVRGLQDLIAASADDLIMIIEFSPMHLVNAGTSGRTLLDLLAGHDWDMYLMDADANGLLPVTARQVRSLNDLTEQDPKSEGFFNLVVAGRSIRDIPAIHFVRDWGMFDNALEYYLLKGRLQAWDGRVQAGTGLEARRLYMPSGWAFPEDWGRWSLGRRSCLKFIPSPSLAARAVPELHIRGRYFGPAEATGVYLGGVLLGNFDLSDARIPLPPGSLAGSHAVLELAHEQPLRPCDVSASGDRREIKFGLESIAIG